MTSISFSDLNERQLAQVAYLFADQYFGTDATLFAYELDKNGDVKGRSRIAGNGHAAGKKRSRQNPAIQVHMIEEVNITDELIRHAIMSMDALAASIAQRIYQSNPIEVEN